MNCYKFGGHFSMWLFGVLILILSFAAINITFAKSTSALTYTNVNRDGWTFWFENSDRKNIIAENDAKDQYAVFIYKDTTNGTQHFEQMPDYYNHSGKPLKDCPAHIDAVSSGYKLWEDEGDKGGCDGKFHVNGDITVAIDAPAYLVEKADLENNGREPLGCPSFAALPPGAPENDRNYNCPDGINSVQKGIYVKDKIILPIADPSDPTAGTGEDVGMTDCESFGGPLGFFICPFIDGIFYMVRGLDSLITKLMIVDTSNIYSNSATSDAYHQAWASFRTMALALVIIACLVIVIASAYGFEFLDAYTIKRTLPKVIIAVIGITVSWQLCEFFINLSNDAGVAVRAMIYAPFTSMEAYSMSGSTQFLLAFSFAAALIVYQIAILLFVVTAALGIFIAILTLVVREMIIIFCVIIAPIAIVCYILPNTQKFWSLWQKTFISLLIVFPIISGFIAMGRVFSTIAYANGTSNAFNNIISFIAYFLPYFMIPVAFKMAGGVMTTLSGIGNDKSRGVFDRLSKARQKSAKQNYTDAVRKDSRLGNTAIGSMYRRAHLARQGGLNPFAGGRRRYADASERLETQVQAERFEKDAGRITGNDDIGDLVQDRNIRNANDLIRRYSNLLVARDGMSRSDANALAKREVAAAQNGYGAPVGSAAFRERAYTAHQLSSTGFTRRDRDVQLYNEDGTADILLAAEHGDENMERMWNQGLALAREGVTSDSRIIANAKKNKARPEISNVPFGATLGILARAQGRAAASGGPATVTADEATRMVDASMAGSTPYELAGGKPETVRIWTERMARRTVDLRSRLDAATASGDVTATQNATIEYNRHMATLAGMYDVMATSSEEKGNIIAGGLMHVQLGNGNTVLQDIEAIRGGLQVNEYFLERRRELNAQARYAQGPPQAGPQGPQGPGGT